MERVWPPQSTPRGPHVLRVRCPVPKPEQSQKAAQQDGRWSEDLIAQLYELHGWQVIAKRFRVRGAEIDLAVMQPGTRDARIIEVKSRRTPGHVDMRAVEELVSKRKRSSLRRGAMILAQRCAEEGKYLNWSADLVLVTPEAGEKSCLVTTWANALDFH